MHYLIVNYLTAVLLMIEDDDDGDGADAVVVVVVVVVVGAFERFAIARVHCSF